MTGLRPEVRIVVQLKLRVLELELENASLKAEIAHMTRFQRKLMALDADEIERRRDTGEP